MDNKKLGTQIIQQIRSWCIDNSFIDYDEEFSDNGDCLILLSELENFLDNLEHFIRNGGGINMTEKEMLDYLLSTGLYEKGSEKHPYSDLYYEQKNLASFELFDLSPDDYLGRQKTHRVPDSYKNMMTEVGKSSTKILINELKRRGFKVAIVKKFN